MPLPLGPITERHSTPYQSTQRTTRSRHRLLDDLISVLAPEGVVAERGESYVVFAPAGGGGYRVGLATFLAIAVLLVVLVLTASSVLWLLLLPTVALPYAPLLLREHTMLAVSALADPAHEGVTLVTVHGTAWGDIGNVLDVYLDHLPAPAPAPPAAPGPATHEPEPRQGPPPARRASGGRLPHDV